MTDSSLIAATAEEQGILQSLEHAAALFTSPDPAGRSQGEAIFLQLRQSPNAIEHALFSLEHSGDPFVHFQCLSVLLEHLPNLSLRTPSKSIASLTTIRDFLYASIVSRSNDANPNSWPNWTRSRAYQTLSAVQLRLLGLELEDAKESHQTGTVIETHTQFILSHIVNLTSVQSLQENQQGFSVGAGVANSLLDEISHNTQINAGNTGSTSNRSKGKSRMVDNTGLSPIQHRWTKAWMQEQILPHLLQSIIQGLSFVLSSQASSVQVPIVPILSSLVNLSEKLLRWSCILTKPWAGLDRNLDFQETSSLLAEDNLLIEDDLDDLESSDQPKISSNTHIIRYIPESLAQILLSIDMISLISSAYRFANQLDTITNREAALCVSRLRRCLLSISSFCQAPQSNIQVDLAGRQTAILKTLALLRDDAQHMSSPLQTDRGQALLFLGQLYSVTLKSTSSVSRDRLQYGIENALQDLSALSNMILTFAFGRRADESDEDDDLDLLADEMIPSLLSAWLALPEVCNDPATLSKISSHTFSGIVKPYIDARLHQASRVSEGETDDDEDEYGEETRPDQEVYEDSLIMFASLARLGNPSEALTYLQTLSDGLLNELVAFYKSPGIPQIGSPELKALEGRWESLHWIILITGHTIADVSKGEVAAVPCEIEILPEQDQQVAVHLIQSLGLKLAQILTDADRSKPQSPQVLQTLLWFNARWIPGYLLVQSTPVLSAKFDAQAGLETLSFLLEKIKIIMGVWVSDSDVILQVSAVLRAFALSEGIMRSLLSISQFDELNRAIIEGLGVLPAKTHKPLISALIGCIYASAATQSPEIFFDRITQAIQSRLSAIVHQPSFTSASVFQRGDVVEDLLNALDMFDGLAASTQPRSARAVYGFLSRFFDTLINLINMYKDRSEIGTSIIRIFRTLIGALDLGFGVDKEIVSSLNEVVWKLMEAMNANIIIGDSPATALEEEIPFEGLCLTLEMLNDLLLASDGDARSPVSDWLADVSHRQTGDVCLFGFSRLVPFLQGDVLSSSGIRTRLAHLTSRLFISFGHRLVGMVIQEGMHQQPLPAASNGHGQGQCVRLYTACVEALSISLNFDETNAVIDSLEAVDDLAKASQRVLREAFNAINGGTAQQNVNQAGQVVLVSLSTPLLDNILRAILIEPIAPTMLEAHIRTLFTLLNVIIHTQVQWQTDGQQEDGKVHLQRHLQSFCSTTSLSSARAKTTSKEIVSSGNVDDSRRRTALSTVIIQLVEYCMSTTGKAQQDSLIEARAREIAWQARSDLKVR
ncbi:hypothetical protein L7F22_052867 [Adiantum nelumboides]|nr:hypothetical protein [Adiantum nelumboides]